MPDALDRWTRLVTLFEDALERPPDERTAWLRAACGDDPALYAEVEALLEGHGRDVAILDGSAADALGPDGLGDVLAAATGERVGPWVLGERIGTGGMGAVYRAHRAAGFDQTAALKRLKPGMDSEAVLGRFRAERQILARLDHPGVARLLDGGLDARGRPYFAMELVDGEPITDAADARRLTVRERLTLFAHACDAVAYAHQALVVHRDLKPSNVLVAADGAVKLLDFGIAKVLSDDAADARTRTGHRVLTPAFAAPEQVRGEPPTTATDVYALGGLLYRLLCGAAPLDTGATRAEAERAVLEGTPERPSARVTAEAAAARATTADALARRLRGDLDVICLKALRTEPERRYGSAVALAADVRRHLDGLPIAARPATARYRAGLFVKRHRAGVLATAAAVAVVAAVTAVAFARVGDERDRARAEARRSDEVVGFLQDLLLGASPYEEPGEELTARELVDRGAERLAALDGEPETQADLQTLIGRVYFDLGRADAAEPLFRAARETRDALGLREPAAISARDLGRALRDLDRPDDAARWLHAALDGLAALPGADPVEVALSERHLGSLLRDQGDYAAAEALYRSALARVRPVLGPDDEVVLDITTSLIIALRALDRGAEAADLMADVIASDRRTLPPDHPNLAGSIATYASLLAQAGRGPEAVDAAREADRIYHAAHPDSTHPNLASSRLGLALALEADGRLAEADRVYADAVGRMRVALGPGDPRVLTATKEHAALKETRGQPDAAAALYRAAAADATAYPRTAGLLWSALAHNRARARAWGEADRAFRQAVTVLDAEGLSDDLDAVAADYAAALREGGRPALPAAVSAGR